MKLRERFFTLVPQFRCSPHLRNRMVCDWPSISSSKHGEDASLVAIDRDARRVYRAMCRAGKDSLPAQHQSRVRQGWFTMNRACRTFLAPVFINGVHALHHVSESRRNA
jgi:hypothetical protein